MSIELEPHPATDPQLLARGRITLQRTSDVQPKPVRHLAPGVPLSHPTLFVDVGVGKSLLTIDLAARLSCGEESGDLLGAPTSIVLVGNEDALAHVIVPRLMAAGADRDLVYYTGGVELPRDTDDLLGLALELDASAIIFDPLTAVFGPRADLHREDSVRPALTPLVDGLASTGIAVVGVVHTRKAHEGSLVDRVLGARAFAAIARSIFAVEAVPEDQDPTGSVRVVRHIKSNLSALLHDRAFRIVPAAVTGWSGETIATARIEPVAEVPRIGSSSPDASGLSPSARRVLSLLPDEDADHRPNIGELGDLLAAQGKPLRRATIQSSLEELAREGLIDEAGGCFWRDDGGARKGAV